MLLRVLSLHAIRVQIRTAQVRGAQAMSVLVVILGLGALLALLALIVLVRIAARLEILPQLSSSELPSEPGEPLSLQTLSRRTHRPGGVL
jgi:hypothetical protein